MAGITQAERERRDRLYEHGLKQCSVCDEPLPLEKFGHRQDGYRSQVEWNGKRWAIDGDPKIYNGSRRTVVGQFETSSGSVRTR